MKLPIWEPSEERKRNAKRGTKSSESERSLDEQFKPMMRASKMLRIMGQIAKNSATSLEGPDKYALLQGSYLLGLRVLKEFLTLFAAGIEEFTQEVKETIRYGWEKEMLKLPRDIRHSMTDSQMEIAVSNLLLCGFVKSPKLHFISFCASLRICRCDSCPAKVPNCQNCCINALFGIITSYS